MFFPAKRAYNKNQISEIKFILFAIILNKNQTRGQNLYCKLVQESPGTNIENSL
jgi:hypothetical protein